MENITYFLQNPLRNPFLHLNPSLPALVPVRLASQDDWLGATSCDAPGTTRFRFDKIQHFLIVRCIAWSCCCKTKLIKCWSWYPHESEEPLKRSQAILTTWYIVVSSNCSGVDCNVIVLQCWGKTWEVESTSASIFLSPGNASEWRGLVQAARPYTCKCNCKYKYTSTSLDRDTQDEDAEDPINQETKQAANHAEQQQVLLHLGHQRSQLLAWIVNCSRHCASHPVKVTKPEIRNQLWNCQLDLFKWPKFKKIVSKGFSDVHILRQYLRSPKV